MSYDDELMCESCKRGDHDNCDGEDQYGEPCRCETCELVQI